MEARVEGIEETIGMGEEVGEAASDSAAIDK